MNVKKRIKANPIVLLLWNEKRRKEAEKFLREYSDIDAIKYSYRQSLGMEPDLAHPQRFTEKLQWLKLYYRNPDIPICTDKYKVREYLENRGYRHLLNELLGVYKRVDEIDFRNLPNQFVLKATHGSGWNLICKDKKEVSWFWWKKILKSWMRQNLYLYGREWNYAEVEPMIVIERYLEDDSGNLRDIKVFCMNGKPSFLQIDEDRYSNHRRVFIRPNGETMDMEDGHEQIKKFEFTEIHHKIVEIASELSRPFPHVRIDFYVSHSKVYFGEFTFFTNSGFYRLNPDQYDLILGGELTLPSANYNIPQLRKR